MLGSRVTVDSSTAESLNMVSWMRGLNQQFAKLSVVEIRPVGSNPTLTTKHGELVEWSITLSWKGRDRSNTVQGFESLTLLQFMCVCSRTVRPWIANPFYAGSIPVTHSIIGNKSMSCENTTTKYLTIQPVHV